MIRRPPRSTLFPTRRSSDLVQPQLLKALEEKPQLEVTQAQAAVEACLAEDSTAACACVTSDRKSTRLNSSHSQISYAVFCLKKKKNTHHAVHEEVENQ